MKRVLVCEKAANSIDKLRDGIGGYEFEKQKVADVLSGLADFVHFLRDSEDEAQYVDVVLRAMSLIADYNGLIDELNESSDAELPVYCLEREDHDALKDGECMPYESQIEIINTILKEKGIKMPDGLSVEVMTKKEVAELFGLCVDDLELMVNKKSNLWNNDITEEQLRRVANMVVDGSWKKKSKLYSGLNMKRVADFLGLSIEDVEERLR